MIAPASLHIMRESAIAVRKLLPEADPDTRLRFVREDGSLVAVWSIGAASVPRTLAPTARRARSFSRNSALAAEQREAAP